MERYDAGQEPIMVTRAVFAGIEAVLRSGRADVMDWSQIAEIAEALGYPQTSEWIKANPSNYTRGISTRFRAPAIDWDTVQLSDMEDCRCEGRQIPRGESDD